MKKFLVLIHGSVDGITQWNIETIRQQWQFSNMPPASIWSVQVSTSVIWPLAKITGFFAFVELLDVSFWRKQWSLGCSSVATEVGLNLDLAGTTFVDFHSCPVRTGSQLALPSLPCQHQGFSETLPRADFSRLTSPCSQLVLSPERLSRLVHHVIPWVSALAQEKQQ